MCGAVRSRASKFTLWFRLHCDALFVFEPRCSGARFLGCCVLLLFSQCALFNQLSVNFLRNENLNLCFDENVREFVSIVLARHFDLAHIV